MHRAVLPPTGAAWAWDDLRFDAVDAQRTEVLFSALEFQRILTAKTH